MASDWLKTSCWIFGTAERRNLWLHLSTVEPIATRKSDGRIFGASLFQIFDEFQHSQSLAINAFTHFALLITKRKNVPTLSRLWLSSDWSFDGLSKIATNLEVSQQIQFWRFDFHWYWAFWKHDKNLRISHSFGF